MRSRLALVLVLLISAVVPARAILPPTRPQVLLLEARTPAELRETLAAYADSAAAAGDPSLRLEAGEASAVLGQSWSRAAERDSAIAAFRRAIDWRGAPEDILALVDELLLRHSPSDLATAVSMLEGDEGMRLGGSPTRRAERDARLAWAKTILGDSLAVNAIEPESREVLETRLEWNDRLGRMLFGAGDMAAARRLLLRVAIDTRRQDAGVMGRLAAAWEADQQAVPLESTIERALIARDTAETHAASRLSGRRVSLRGADGVALGGVATGLGPVRRRAAIVLMPADASFVDADSLAAHLHRAGLKALFLDPRGSRLSASPQIPSPRVWRGREDEMQVAIANDARAALAALARLTPVDTTRYVVVGIGTMAPVAVGAAWLDKRVSTLLLVAPWAALPDRGPMRAALAALKRPVYLQIGPEEFDSGEYANRLADACDPRLVRVADSASPGAGATLFRAGPAVGRRYADWLRDQMGAAAPGAPRRTVVATPRRTTPTRR